MPDVDLNVDVGEGGACDAEVLAFVTSANIACGYHAGDPAMMRETVQAARDAGVAVGAHPGFADREHFGRRVLQVTPREVYDLVVYQVGALAAFAAAAGMALQHVKPHGALYNMVAADPVLADAVARAVHDVDRGLVVFGLAGSHALLAAERIGLRALSEAFTDRNYMADGTLVPRNRPDALLTDFRAPAERAVRMVRERRVHSVDGADIPIVAESLCIHGDGPYAVELARELRESLERGGISVKAPGRAT